ncbi:hypothetical protein GCM10011348_20220 [Marinobacterium nitratireducens]|uniref:Phasin domain-containing protein n=1 Tax=Marinobacterium nitratireducens TaxID=518897 RepID=A0A917ZDD5_9GAMM|nr:hypothetical protein [Marinobacterium nitratireducens]GGO81363.1 hypothetical protein GCM10011348_20220 [Marinobacterium nitratireducens]
MNQSVTELFDTSLLDAVEQWNDYANDNAQTERVLWGLFTPVKDSLQIAQQVMEAVQAGNWTLPASLPDPEVLGGITSELGDIQAAAFQKMLDEVGRYQNTGAEAGKLLSEALETSGEPQKQLASWLEASLKVTKAYQEDFNQQLADLGAIQSAYTAWWQKSVESLFAGKA